MPKLTASMSYNDFIATLYISRVLGYIVYFPWSLAERRKLLLWELHYDENPSNGNAR